MKTKKRGMEGQRKKEVQKASARDRIEKKENLTAAGAKREGRG